MSATDPSIEPTQVQLERLAASGEDGPVMMINLLRFKEQADGIDADDGITGAEAYARYGAAVQPYLEGVGGRVLLGLRRDRVGDRSGGAGVGRRVRGRVPVPQGVPRDDQRPRVPGGPSAPRRRRWRTRG